MAFNDDIENINYYVYHNLKPFTRKSERRHIRLHISQSFFQFLKKEYKIGLLTTLKKTTFRLYLCLPLFFDSTLRHLDI